MLTSYTNFFFSSSSIPSISFGLIFFSYSTSTVANLPIACLLTNSFASNPNAYVSFNENLGALIDANKTLNYYLVLTFITVN